MRTGTMILLIVLAGITSCNKGLSFIYAVAEDVTVSAKGDTCVPSGIAVKNLNNIEEVYTMSYTLPEWGKATALSIQNKVAATSLSLNRSILNDTLSLFDGDSVFTDKIQQLVTRIVTRKNPLRFRNESNDYRFTYKDSLLVKKVCYVNGDTLPYFSTVYDYDATTRQLTSVHMKFEPEDRLLFESKISYDTANQVVPWTYLYTDFFSLAEHLLLFPFGKRTTRLPVSMESIFYDADGTTTLGNWKTLFSAYKISKDRYVLNVNCAGQKLESLPWLYQNVQFTYQCK